MEPMVTAMWSHARKVRSLAKKVLGSILTGRARAILRGGARPSSCTQEGERGRWETWQGSVCGRMWCLRGIQ